MANNKIQVKRTSTSGRTPNTTNAGNAQYIAAGELALNMADGIMYTSNGSVLIPVGANNVDVNVSGNLTVKAIIANGSIGSASQLLTSNGSAVYWSSPGAASVNVNAQYTWTNTHIFTNTVTFSNGQIQMPSGIDANSFIFLQSNASSTNTVNVEIKAQNYFSGNALYGVIGLYAQANTSSTNGSTASAYLTTNTDESGNSYSQSVNFQFEYVGFKNSNSSQTSVASLYGDFREERAYLRQTYANSSGPDYYIEQVANSTMAIITASNNSPTVSTRTYSYIKNDSIGVGNTSVNLAINSTSIALSGNIGTSGQVLTSNGTALTWSTPSAGVNVNAQYVWTNTQTFQNTITFSSTILGTVNNSLNLNGKSEAGLNVNNALTSNNASYLDGTIAAAYVQNTDSRTLSGNLIFSGANVTSTGNFRFSGGVFANGALGTAGHTLHSNGTSVYWAADDQGVTSVASGNGITGGTITTTGTLYVTQGTGIVVNATGVHVNSTYIGTLSANNSSYLGGVIAASYVQNTDSRTLSGNIVFTANVTLKSIIANSSLGSSGQVLTSNGTTVYWSTPTGGSGSVNVDAQYTWTNTQSFTNVITFSNNIIVNGISANGGYGSAGQVLTSNGSDTYWSTSAGGTPGVGTGSGSDDTFFINGQFVNTAYTTSATKNYLSAGPITLNANVTITSGSRWSIV
jgi:hypothetical protein